MGAQKNNTKGNKKRVLIIIGAVVIALAAVVLGYAAKEGIIGRVSNVQPVII